MKMVISNLSRVNFGFICPSFGQAIDSNCGLRHSKTMAIYVEIIRIAK